MAPFALRCCFPGAQGLASDNLIAKVRGPDKFLRRTWERCERFAPHACRRVSGGLRGGRVE